MATDCRARDEGGSNESRQILGDLPTWECIPSNGQLIACTTASPQRGNREGEKNGKEDFEEVEEGSIDQDSFGEILVGGGCADSVQHTTRDLTGLRWAVQNMDSPFPFFGAPHENPVYNANRYQA